MDLAKDDIVIISGEGACPVTIERYHGSRTRKAIQNKLSRERCKGYRQADAWILTRQGNVYGKLTRSLDAIIDEAMIPEACIIDNPAAVLAHRRAKK